MLLLPKWVWMCIISLLRFRGISSAGRALAWHARGQRFDPAILHQEFRSLSSRGLGHDPFTVGTGVRIPVGTPRHKTRRTQCSAGFAISERVCFSRPPAVRGISSAGRALAWHARGQRFDPAILHQEFRSLSSRGLGHDPFTVGTGVRIPVGTPLKFLLQKKRR